MFNCPKCDKPSTGAGNTVVGAPAPPGWFVVVLSCQYCQAALGAYAAPQK